jgi:hypothetical protein
MEHPRKIYNTTDDKNIVGQSKTSTTPSSGTLKVKGLERQIQSNLSMWFTSIM